MYNSFGKRLIDIVLSAIILVVTSPIMLVAAIAIKLSSKGPIVFKQTRMGKDHQPFKLYKFRSMRIDTPEIASNDLNGDDYHTAVGKFIRKFSIDELPQLFNVIKGDMSIIGPRPIILKEKNLLDLRHQNGAESVRPGITGLAQVNGRDNLADEPKARYDAEYAKNVSLKNDGKIFMKTILYVIKRDGVVEEQIDDDSTAGTKNNHKDK
ncbi:sugar transferase [Periweissella ghanensis]|uniref:Undecaprenyl phosphate N,N'-diacetylbacillosamine 1-phosphate transferase n=1 Tax=Periweissella ghanensis TaxID=467997 RepID=A0ABM8ZCX1_9LACO|nr:sugar transferase [Periweissella ghanensis]MCM0600228.1 sugar transferase [Periweissella ghanensis]CAH0419140.1 Undecaprenyl phosphate N,N'-diacetylbacillosamine 1-phosphate transferase [Periweissella ghanensis]